MAQSHRPRQEGPPAPGEVVELRVHGVGGATPEELLDVPLTELVAGDEGAGFFRPWLTREPSGHSLEGYSWGGLTSAARARALWVLLTPFALANLAGWMLRHGGEPTDTEPRSRDAVETTVVALVRLFGVMLTVAVAAYLSVAGMDLLAYQCGAHPTCAGGRWWLSPWESGLVAGSPGRAIAVGALVPLLSVAGLAWLTRRSQLAIHDDDRVGFDDTGDPAFTVNLNHGALWASPHVAHRLGLTHTAAALAATGVGAATILDRAGDATADPLVVSGWAILALSLAAVIRLDGVGPRFHIGLAILAAVHALAGVAILWSASVPAAGGPLPGAQVVAGALLPAYPAVALAVGLGAWVLWRRDRQGKLRVALVAPALLLIGSGIINAFGSGLLIRLADLLGSPVAASDHPLDTAVTQPPIVYADAVADAAVVTVFALLVLALAAVIEWIRAGDGPCCQKLAEDYADRGGLDCRDSGDIRWAQRVGRAQAQASLTDRAAAVVATTTVVVAAASGLAVLLSDDPAGMGLGSWTDRLAGPASVVLGIIPLVAVWGISRLYRSRAVRRVVGIVWDVATFWPRWFHPWSPPSYGERAVPQLGHRLAALTATGNVVLSAHSQGSVLAVATLLRCETTVRERTALLTHGSPLTRLYASFFPECFSKGTYTGLARDVSGWVNLWRPTDFIGGKIGAEGVEDEELFDPPSTRATSPGERRPVPARHSDYDRDDDYRRVVANLAG